jgi:hypothetical protein
MSPRRHQLLRETLEFLKAAGATDISYRINRHIKVFAKAPHTGSPLMIVLSASPSGQSAHVNNLAVVKRELRRAAQAGREQ